MGTSGLGQDEFEHLKSVDAICRVGARFGVHQFGEPPLFGRDSGALMELWLDEVFWQFGKEAYGRLPLLLVEATKKSDYSAIGQLFVYRELFKEDFQRNIECMAIVCEKGDSLIERACRNLAIIVYRVEAETETVRALT